MDISLKIFGGEEACGASFFEIWVGIRNYKSVVPSFRKIINGYLTKSVR